MSVWGWLRQKRGDIAPLAAEYGGRSVRIFVSAARDSAEKHSDVDFLVEYGVGAGAVAVGRLGPSTNSRSYSTAE